MNFSSERVYPGLESFAGFSGESGFGTPAIGKVQFLQAKAESPTQRAYLETQGAGTGYQGRAHSEPQAARPSDAAIRSEQAPAFHTFIAFMLPLQLTGVNSN